jgi:hypothetical protein
MEDLMGIDVPDGVIHPATMMMTISMTTMMIIVRAAGRAIAGLLG